MTAAGRIAGCRILITAKRRAEDFAAALERHGAVVDIVPVLSVQPQVDNATLLATTDALIERPPQIVVITTGVGLRGWWEAADAAGTGEALLAALAASRLIVRGPKANGAARAAGLTPDWVAESETHGEIRDLLLTEGVAGKRIVVQHHGAGSDGLDQELRDAGADVVPVVTYSWGPPEDPAAVAASVRRAAQGHYDAVAFTSAPAAAAFLSVTRELDLLPDLVAACDGTLIAAAVGTVTAEPLRRVGIEPLVPERFRLGALVRTLVEELDRRHRVQVTTPLGVLQILGSAAVLNGTVLPLSPTGVMLLRRLADAGGSVVSRDELRRALPGDDSSPHAVEVAVARLRQSLPDPELITTVIKRGYRLSVDDGSAGVGEMAPNGEGLAGDAAQ